MRRRRPKRANTAQLLIGALIGSALIHLVLWPLGDRLVKMRWGGQPIPMGEGVMEVSLLPLEDATADPADKTTPEERDPDGKLVNLDRLVDERPPEDTEHLSEFDNSVEQETRAPNRHPKPGPPKTQAGDRPDGNQGTDDAKAPKTPPTPTSAKALAMGRDALADDGDGSSAADVQLPDGSDAKAANDPGKMARLNPRGLRGVPDSLRKSWGQSGSLDGVSDDIEEGDENILNSRRWKYASFFNRIRNAVSEHWHPEVLHAARDPEGRIHGTKTRRTKLLISLNPDGSVAKIRLERRSGVGYLDEEAIRAVRAAGPFSNPPPGLVNPDTNRIDFGFAFIFEINGGRRIFRYKRP